MPAQSEKQKHFFDMVRAIQAGHEITGVSSATQKQLHVAATSMSRKQVADFAHVATKPKAKK